MGNVRHRSRAVFEVGVTVLVDSDFVTYFTATLLSGKVGIKSI